MNLIYKCVLLLSIGTLLLASSKEVDIFDLTFDDLQHIEVITATKSKTTISKAPATVRIVTADMIKKRGYMTLEGALSDLPGFDFRNINGFNSYLFIRGVPNQNNLIVVMVDGVKINELNSGGFYGGLQYNLFNVKQIEVNYGPSSALYGTNAFSGVINIITYSPKDKEAQESRVAIATGSFDTHQAAFRSGSYDKKSEFGYTVAAHYVTSEKADLAGSDGDNNWGESMENFEDSFSLEGKLSYKSFDFGLIFQDKKASRTTNYSAVEELKREYGTLWHISFFNVWLRHSAKLTSELELKSQIYYRDTTVHDDTIGYIDITAQVGYYRPNNLYGIDEEFHYKPTSDLFIIAGATYEKESLSESISKSYSSSADTPPPAPAEPNMLENDLLSIYTQVQYDILDELQLTFGLRYDDSSYYDQVTTPKAALVYSFDDSTVKLLYSEAFRAPKPWDVNNGIDSNAEIKSYELSYARRFLEYIFADIALYYNELTFVNSDDITTRGLEATLKYAYEGLTGYANYTYTDSENQDSIEVDEISKHHFNTGIEYMFSDKLHLDLRLNYASKRKNPSFITTTQSDYIDAYTVVNSQLSYLNYYGADLHLIVSNLFDEEYYHSSNRSVDRYTQPQKSVLLKAEYSF